MRRQVWESHGACEGAAVLAQRFAHFTGILTWKVCNTLKLKVLNLPGRVLYCRVKDRKYRVEV